MTEEEIAQLVADDRIVGFTVDTTEFHHAGYRFDSKSLLGLGQFKGTPIPAVLSEVVLNEVHAHLRDRIKEASELARGALRTIGKVAALGFDPAQVIEQLGIPGDAGLKSRELLDAYLAKIGAVTIAVDEGVSLRRLHDLYFSASPPFSSKADKKNEFPDAIALLSLEHWVQQRDGYLLAVSDDGDWSKFAKQSEHLICVPKLPAALNLFKGQEHVVAQRLAGHLQNGTAQTLSSLISGQVSRLVETYDLEASAPYSYDTEDEYGELDSWRLADHRFDVIASDDDSVTVAFTIHVEAVFHASFNFSVWDSIDRESIGVGGVQAKTTEAFDLQVNVTIARDDEEVDPDIMELDLEGEVPTVDFGYVETDYSDDHDEE